MIRIACRQNLLQYKSLAKKIAKSIDFFKSYADGCSGVVISYYRKPEEIIRGFLISL